MPRASIKQKMWEELICQMLCASASVQTMEEFLMSMDSGLLAYQDEFIQLSVTSEQTLRYLKPSEVRSMRMPEVYKRMVIDKILKLQTPESKEKLKRESKTPVNETPACTIPRGLPPKKLKFDSSVEKGQDEGRPLEKETSPAPTNSNAMEKEIDRLRAEKEIRTLETKVKNLDTEIESILSFLKHNAMTFISAVRPKLMSANPLRYKGKDGNQTLQRDLRLIKIATGGKIPKEDTKDGLVTLIEKGKLKVNYVCDEDTLTSSTVSSDQVQSTVSTPVTAASYSQMAHSMPLPYMYSGSFIPYGSVYANCSPFAGGFGFSTPYIQGTPASGLTNIYGSPIPTVPSSTVTSAHTETMHDFTQPLPEPPPLPEEAPFQPPLPPEFD